MNKILALTYSFLILIQSFNINLDDISKINALIDHAQFHKEMYGDSFFDFLAEHYGEARDNHENDHKEHKDLPFKDNHHMCTHINLSFISPNISFKINNTEFIEIPFNFIYKESFTSFEKPSVFQPPKHA
ncbi:hypothetical protein [Mesoflavibacter sp. SCSIO 43206]|uniref:hypothetical protein n=1 Tax=Mesoflavibacter sp. SCSIO 43206 TaxID=2779362 RepID=UPI001CA89BC8|nr:hypothetical protein [Mesoflavibacter sp. SCSIO 43206]UAB76240.1 hypothetical protein INR78_04415 [Mesoflavibacter sp. SCSIO 43206]